MKKKVATIKDVARETGVSIAAVSQAFNSVGRLSAETRKRVMAAARNLKYYPNRHARSLAGEHSQTLGILVSDIENPFFAVVVKNFEAQARRHGFEAVASETGFEVPLMRRAGERMLEQNVDGVAIMTTEMSSAWFREIMRRGIPITCFDHHRFSKCASSIGINYFAAVEELLKYLYQVGHRHFAYVGGQQKFKSISSRLNGYVKGMASLGLDPGPILLGNPSLAGGYAAGLSLLELPARPTAVVAVNDLTAVGLINALCERGLEVPRDISVAGFDNTYFAAYFVPRLTTVDFHADILGRTAADALVAAIFSPGNYSREYAIKFDLVVGKSTGPPPPRLA